MVSTALHVQVRVLHLYNYLISGTIKCGYIEGYPLQVLRRSRTLSFVTVIQAMHVEAPTN